MKDLHDDQDEERDLMDEQFEKMMAGMAGLHAGVDKMCVTYASR